MTGDRTPRRPTGTAVTIGNVRVFDGVRVLADQHVVINDGAIARVGPAGRETVDVDGRGHTLLPGLFDAHVHVAPDPEVPLRRLAGMGITTALDMFCGDRVLARIRRLRLVDPPHLAAVRTAGPGATARGSGLAKIVGQPLPTVDGPAAADAWVHARLRDGADYIKIVYDERAGGPLDQATVAALVHAAHARGVLAVAHTLAEEPARQAVAAGVDGLVHLFIGDRAGADFGTFAADHHVFVIPTLTVLRGLCGHRPHLYRAATAALGQLVSAGVPILAGTDTGRATAALGVYDYGATLHAELELMVQAGLSPVQALRAATSAPAGAFRLTDRGQIAPGMRADLILVDGDPTTDIHDTRNLVAVWKNGQRLEPDEGVAVRDGRCPAPRPGG